MECVVTHYSNLCDNVVTHWSNLLGSNPLLGAFQLSHLLHTAAFTYTYMLYFIFYIFIYVSYIFFARRLSTVTSVAQSRLYLSSWNLLMGRWTQIVSLRQFRRLLYHSTLVTQDATLSPMTWFKTKFYIFAVFEFAPIMPEVFECKLELKQEILRW